MVCVITSSGVAVSTSSTAPIERRPDPRAVLCRRCCISVVPQNTSCHPLSRCRPCSTSFPQFRTAPTRSSLSFDARCAVLSARSALRTCARRRFGGRGTGSQRSSLADAALDVRCAAQMPYPYVQLVRRWPTSARLKQQSVVGRLEFASTA